MRCLTVIMSVLIAASILSPAASESSALKVEYIATAADPYYVKTDQPCFVSRLVSNCNDGRNFHDPENPISPGATVSLPFDRMTCWKLEYGNLAAFDWDYVREYLRMMHGVEVGAVATCHVAVAQRPIEGYDVVVAVYTAYERQFYRVTRDQDVAVISVLVPVHGITRVYSNVARLTAGSCGYTTVAAPVSDLGVCANMGRLPFNGDCGDGGEKRRFHQEPVPATPDHGIDATWGGIKALYE